ncbi:hypothetical protein RRG08_055094, partial [Elysia crispata]
MFLRKRKLDLICPKTNSNVNSLICRLAEGVEAGAVECIRFLKTRLFDQESRQVLWNVFGSSKLGYLTRSRGRCCGCQEQLP